MTTTTTSQRRRARAAAAVATFTALGIALAPLAGATPAPKGPTTAAAGAPANAHVADQSAEAAPAAAQGESPGNRGTVKTHRSTTPDDDRRDEPHVCQFRILGFGFPEDANLEISIVGHGGPNAGPDSFSTTVTAGQLSDAGDFAIAGPTLANGMYKLSLDDTTAPGGSKHKVLKVDCPATSESTAPSPGPTLTPEVGGDSNAEVLGETITRPAEHPSTQTGVKSTTVVRGAAGVSAARSSADVAGSQVTRSSLPVTGADILVLALVASLLVGTGLGATLLGRRRVA